MNFKGFFGRTTLAALVALSMGACSTVDYRSASAPIEVIESNYMESTNDAEIVLNEAPTRFFAMVKVLIGA